MKKVILWAIFLLAIESQAQVFAMLLPLADRSGQEIDKNLEDIVQQRQLPNQLKKEQLHNGYFSQLETENKKAQTDKEFVRCVKTAFARQINDDLAQQITEKETQLDDLYCQQETFDQMLRLTAKHRNITIKNNASLHQDILQCQIELRSLYDYSFDLVENIIKKYDSIEPAKQ